MPVGDPTVDELCAEPAPTLGRRKDAHSPAQDDPLHPTSAKMSLAFARATTATDRHTGTDSGTSQIA